MIDYNWLSPCDEVTDNLDEANLRNEAPSTFDTLWNNIGVLCCMPCGGQFWICFISMVLFFISYFVSAISQYTPVWVILLVILFMFFIIFILLITSNFLKEILTLWFGRKIKDIIGPNLLVYSAVFNIIG